MPRDSGIAPNPLSASAFLIEQFTIEPTLNHVSRNSHIVHLEPKAMQLLVFMAERAGEVLSREELIDHIWTGAFVTDQVLSNAISQIRQAFGENGKEYIQTIPKNGYRLTGRVMSCKPEIPLVPPRTPSSETSSQVTGVTEDAGTDRILPPKPTGFLTARTIGVGAGFLFIVYAVLLAFDVGGIRERLAGLFTGGRPIKALAVLPVKNLSGDPGQEFFADGMTDELIAGLAQIKAIKVVSRTSVMVYKNTTKTLPQIAKELGVDGVLEASVMRSGGRFRLTAQLIDGREDRHLWAKTYERELTEVLRIQSEVATSVAREIKAALTPAEQARLTSAQAVNPEIYEAYLKGQYYSAQFTVDSVPKAIAEFEAAIAKDPQYAPAHAGLATVYIWALGRQLPGLSDRVAYKLAENAARLAIQLDPGLEQGHTALGEVLSATLRPYSAEKEFRKALELNPNSAAAEMGYALALLRLERNDEALAHVQRAGELDPISQLMYYRRISVYAWAGDVKRSAELLQTVLKLEPDSPSAYFFSTMQNLAEGHYEKVGCDDPRIAGFGRNPERMAFLTYCYGKIGRQDDARRMFRQMQDHPDFPQMYPRMLAMAYAGIGDQEKAKAAMERAWELRPPWYDEVLLERNSKFPPDPRFEIIKQAIRASYEEDRAVAAASRP